MAVKSVLITGCGPNGIGAALAKAFHLRGHKVFATVRSMSNVDPELQELGVQIFELDVTSEEDIQKGVQTVKAATWGKLDILINNAGIDKIKPFLDTPLSEARQTFEVNVFACYAVTQAFMPLLLEAQGMVVGLGSITHIFCSAFQVPYSASKAALEAMMRTMRRELAPLGVRVVVLKTGSVGTNLFRDGDKLELPEGSFYAPVRDFVSKREFLSGARFITPEKFAEEVVPQLLKPEPKAFIWSGGLVWMAWFLSWLGWETMMVSGRRS